MRKNNTFNLKEAFADFQNEMIQELSTNRKHIHHAVSKGSASEFKWIETLGKYLPERYSVDKAFVIDSKGKQSEELDVVIYDRQYSPFLFNRETSLFIPAESVYAVFEIKQTINKKYLEYAGKKASSVRKLFRTSAPVPYVEGKYKKKPLYKIISGILTLDSDWQLPFGKSFVSVLKSYKPDEQLDLGCILNSGYFKIKYKSNKYFSHEVTSKENALILFFLDLFSKLQKLGTCPAIDIEKYTKSIVDAKSKKPAETGL